MIKEVASTVLNKIVYGAESLSDFPIIHDSFDISESFSENCSCSVILNLHIVCYPCQQSLPLVTIIQAETSL